MARGRFHNLPPERREAILAAAAEEFAERGYEAASLNRIAERSGTSKGSLYYYFENKADLFETVVEEAGAKAAGAASAAEHGAWIEALTAEDFWDGIREQSRRSVQELHRDDWYMKVARAFHRLLDEPAAEEATRRALEHTRRRLYRMIERGQELGAVRTDLPVPMLVAALMGMSEGAKRWIVAQWDEWTPEEADTLLDGYIDLVRDMLDAAHQGWDR